MNSLFNLNGNSSSQRSNLVNAVQNRNNSVLFVMGAALTISTALYAKSFKVQEYQERKEGCKRKLCVSNHRDQLLVSLSRKTNDGQKKLLQKQKSSEVSKGKSSVKKSLDLVLNLKQLLERAESADNNTLKVPKQKSPSTSMNELIETQKAHSQRTKIWQAEQINCQNDVEYENAPSNAQIPPLYITHQEIDEKRRSLNSRKVSDWKVPERLAVRERRQLRKLE